MLHDMLLRNVGMLADTDVFSLAFAPVDPMESWVLYVQPSAYDMSDEEGARSLILWRRLNEEEHQNQLRAVVMVREYRGLVEHLRRHIRAHALLVRRKGDSDEEVIKQAHARIADMISRAEPGQSPGTQADIERVYQLMIDDVRDALSGHPYRGKRRWCSLETAWSLSWQLTPIGAWSSGRHELDPTLLED